MHLSHMHDCGTTAAVPKSAAMAALLGRPYIYEIGALPENFIGRAVTRNNHSTPTNGTSRVGGAIGYG